MIIIDQISKLLVRFYFEYGKQHKIIGEWVSLTFIENRGMAFGIQFGGQTFFTVFSLLATVVIFIYIVRAREERVMLRLSLTLILGGAVGNLIDRFLYGGVVDFIDVRVGGIDWPIFNIADSAVTIGMVMLLTMILFDKSPQKADEGKKIAA
ncbi:MAG: signal peptidase II [bacterium]